MTRVQTYLEDAVLCAAERLERGSLDRRRVLQLGALLVVVGMAVLFGLIEIAAGLMPSYVTYAAILPVLGLAALLTLIGAWQVWLFVAWRGWPVAGPTRRWVRLVAGNALGELATGPVHAHELGLDRDRHGLGDGDGLAADARHGGYQTSATTSPPTPALRASWPVITPWDVDRMAVPMPPSTFGTCRAST